MIPLGIFYIGGIHYNNWELLYMYDFDSVHILCYIYHTTSNLGKFSRWTPITTSIISLIKIFSLGT
ncbi:CMP170.5L [Camelpox virus CMS]|uniref:CMP170.5L n=1 Tax=Camelpox virus (strain CMS) TaxID=203172 RepID=Q8QQ18_CAMPS|nr:CMP170.5L [Camelpox virus CMS]